MSADNAQANALTDAAIEVLRSGALDLNPILSYTAVLRIGNKRGVSLHNWDTLEQAARNVMVEREEGGCMIWEIPTVKFGEEYARLTNEAG